MRKDTLIEIILGTLGGLIFAVGMCMCLLPEWNMFTIGIVISVVGFLILLCIIPIYKRNHLLKEYRITDKSLVTTIMVGITGSLVMGFGMSKIMVENTGQHDIIIGMITGIIGLLICILNYPIYAYLKK